MVIKIILTARDWILYLKILNLRISYYQSNVIVTLVTSNVSIDKLQGLNFILDQICVSYEKEFAVKTFTYFGTVKVFRQSKT